MKIKVISGIILSFMIFSFAGATSKMISAEKIRTNRVENRVQYIKKGQRYFDLEQAPVVVTVNDSDGSIEVFAPNIAPKDSVYFQFIPGNLISVCVSALVVWNDDSNLFQYSYTLFSDTSSKRPIMMFETEWQNYYWDFASPKKWDALSLPEQGRNGWSTIGDHNMLLPGETLSGFGFLSSAPPVIASFKVRGETENIVYNFSRGYEGLISDVQGMIISKNRDVVGRTIIPGIPPERIEPVEWFRHRIYFSLISLNKNGYINSDIDDAIRPILDRLSKTFKSKENHTITKLEQEVNDTLVELEPYQNQMEPEAWAFITENLKYVLRNKDIVKFKYYP